MITQTLRRWLNKLVAWWPWKRVAAGEYMPAASNLNKGSVQEHAWRTKVVGPEPQANIASVAVEQGMEDNLPEAHRLSSDERIERAKTSPPAPADTSQHMLSMLSRNSLNDTNATASDTSSTAQERRLMFLRYLVQRGIVSEDIPAEQQADGD